MVQPAPFDDHLGITRPIFFRQWLNHFPETERDARQIKGGRIRRTIA